MQTRVSSNGEATLSEAVVRSLGAGAGDSLDIQMDGDRVIVRATPEHAGKLRLVKDPISGLIAGHIEGAPILTNREVEEALADFP